jgi:hypothetical protein
MNLLSFNDSSHKKNDFFNDANSWSPVVGQRVQPADRRRNQPDDGLKQVKAWTAEQKEGKMPQLGKTPSFPTSRFGGAAAAVGDDGLFRASEELVKKIVAPRVVALWQIVFLLRVQGQLGALDNGQLSEPLLTLRD